MIEVDAATGRRLWWAGMSEKALMARLKAEAERLGYRCVHHWTSIRSEPGFPDLVCAPPVGSGLRVCGFEVKARSGRVTAAQQGWLDRLNAAGVPALLVRPCDEDWDRALAILAGEGAGEER